LADLAGVVFGATAAIMGNALILLGREWPG
jgi:hypothetical protein